MMTKRVILLTTAIVLSLAVTAALYGWYSHKEARALIRDVSDLSHAQDRAAIFSRLRHKYGNRMNPGTSCTREWCYYVISINNRALAFLRLIPYTELKAYIQLHEDDPSGASLEYRTALAQGISPVVLIQDDFEGGTEPYVNPHDSDGEAVTNGLVVINATTPEAIRKRAFALNIDCLTRLGGCRDGRDLLPGIW
ncbi:MAG: hypothetical protein LAN83_12155 [Acidobacteriia bacterium]|nr:hypothetical protein [Terriglobia bacterium]